MSGRAQATNFLAVPQGRIDATEHEARLLTFADRVLAALLLALLRAARRLSLARPRVRRPWPGRAHAHLAAAIVSLEEPSA